MIGRRKQGNVTAGRVKIEDQLVSVVFPDVEYVVVIKDQAVFKGSHSENAGMGVEWV